MNPKILIVDDSQLMNQMIRDILEAAGYETQSALSGPQALKLAETWVPDLVLLDIMMPEMDGFEVCRQLRKREKTRSVPVMMVTAKASIVDKQQGFEAGADDYLTKPFEPTELKLRLSAMLKRTQQQGEIKSEPGHHILVVHSLRGGSGCTSLAVNIALGLQQLWDAPVALVDMVRPMGVCGSMLNLQPYHRLNTIVDQSLEEMDHDMVAGYLSTHENGVKLLGGFSDPISAEKLTENLVSYLLTQLQDMFQYIVVDISHDYSPPTIAALDMADQIILPVTPDINAARLAQAELKMLESLGYEKRPFLIQNWTFSKEGISRAQLEKYLGQPFDFIVPHAAGEWSKAINTGTPVIANDVELPIVRLLEDLAWRLSDPLLRSQKPERPTPMWTRMQKRKQAAAESDRKSSR
ncbi:MAG: response regulator [Anaerolineales bacterium]|nr:response regulator [Anaerolineales bacterium]